MALRRALPSSHVTAERVAAAAGIGPAMTAVSPYLDALAGRAAGLFAPHTEVSITLRHHGANVRAASSDDRAARCDQVENRLDDGPCITAMEQLAAELVPDVAAEARWAAWCAQATEERFASALAMPAHVAHGFSLAVNFYSSLPDPWQPRALVAADAFAQRVALAVSSRLQLATAAHDGTIADPTTTVEQAVGATMECNACTAQEARDLLLETARVRGVALEVVAATILDALSHAERPGPLLDASRAAHG